MRISLTGNPNSGKTTMLNTLTGRNEKVGKWAGVTVENRGARYQKVLLQIGQHPDCSGFAGDLLHIAVYQRGEHHLLELEFPIVVALNKSDVSQKKENRMDTEKLDCPGGGNPQGAHQRPEFREQNRHQHHPQITRQWRMCLSGCILHCWNKRGDFMQNPGTLSAFQVRYLIVIRKLCGSTSAVREVDVAKKWAFPG